jgi:hypothetical protein
MLNPGQPYNRTSAVFNNSGRPVTAMPGLGLGQDLTAAANAAKKNPNAAAGVKRPTAVPATTSGVQAMAQTAKTAALLFMLKSAQGGAPVPGPAGLPPTPGTPTVVPPAPPGPVPPPAPAPSPIPMNPRQQPVRDRMPSDNKQQGVLASLVADGERARAVPDRSPIDELKSDLMTRGKISSDSISAFNKFAELYKRAKQDNSKPSRSGMGEQNGLSYEQRKEDHATGTDAWASLDRFRHKKANDVLLAHSFVDTCISKNMNLDQIAAAVVKVGMDYDTTVQTELIAGIEKIAADYISPILKKVTPDFPQLGKNITKNVQDDLGGALAGAAGGASAGYHHGTADPNDPNVVPKTFMTTGLGALMGAINPKRSKAPAAPVAPTKTPYAPTPEMRQKMNIPDGPERRTAVDEDIAMQRKHDQTQTDEALKYQKDLAAHTADNSFKLRHAVPHSGFQATKSYVTGSGYGSLIDDLYAYVSGAPRTNVAGNALGALGAMHGGLRGLSYLSPTYGLTQQAATAAAAPVILGAVDYMRGSQTTGGPAGALAKRLVDIPWHGSLSYLGRQEEKEKQKTLAANPNAVVPPPVFARKEDGTPTFSLGNLTRNAQTWVQTQAIKPLETAAKAFGINTLMKPDGTVDYNALQNFAVKAITPSANKVVDNVRQTQVDQAIKAVKSQGMDIGMPAVDSAGNPVLGADKKPLLTIDPSKIKTNAIAKGTELGGAAVDDIVKNKMRAFKKRLGRTGQQVNQFTDPMFNMLGMGQMSPWQRYALLAGGLAGGAGMFMQNPYMMGAGALGMGAGMYPHVGGMANPWLQRQYGFGLPGTNVYTGQLPPTAAPPQQ